tara:strand:- start:4701 stop:5534 length:834 start_codon:yes stop_codon:yes gene_type:complete
MIENKILNCQCCGEKKINFTKTFNDKDFYTCNNCNSLTFLNKNFNHQDIYTQNYFKNGEYENYIEEIKVHEKNFHRSLKILKKYSDLSEINLLEIGSAYGVFINLISQKLNVQNRLGIDISKDAVKYANDNFGKYFLQSEKYLKPNFKFNLVVALDVFEHLSNPFDYFKEVIFDLEPGGYFLVQTPDYSSLNAKIRKRNWRQIHPPTHLNYATKKGIVAGLKKMGMEIVFNKNVGMYRSLNTYFKSLNFNLENKLIKNIPIYLNLFDEQLILAKKIN